MADPIDYNAGLNNSLMAGARLGGLMGMAKQQELQNNEAQRQREMAKAFQTDWQSSFGDPQKMTELAAKYPQMMDQIKTGIGFKDEQHQMAMGSAARDLRVAMSTGKPASVYQAAAKHAQTLGSINSSPEDIMQQYMSNPQGLAQTVEAVGMSALGAKDYYGVENDRATRAEIARNNDMTNARGWASNNIAQQNVNVRKLELQDKALDRQLSRETNQARLGILQDKRDTTQRELEKAKTEKVDTYNTSMDTMNRTIETANKVLNSPGFTGYFGVNLLPGTNRWVPGTDAADTGALVDTLKSQGFMSGIQQMRGLGALSNMEGQRVMDAIGNLSHNQSEKSARAAINTIIETTTKAQERMRQKYGNDIPQPDPQKQQSQISDDDLVNKYLGG